MTLVAYDTVETFREACDAIRRRGERIGLVPTMGALHEGHLSLIREAQHRADHVAVTIFVNPAQFGPNEDYAKYPRDLDGDRKKCEGAGASLLFAPSVEAMYPSNERTRVSVSGLTESLCGSSRPGHFDGVATIVTKLFAVAGPCVAVFGSKDYQQLKVIERMARDLLLPVEVVGAATVREADGLAMSSRNAYLDDEQRQRASHLPKSLQNALQLYRRGERRVGALRAVVVDGLGSGGFRVDYVTLACANELSVLADDESIERPAVIAVAAFMGATRLIDNLVLGEEEPAALGASEGDA